MDSASERSRVSWCRPIFPVLGRVRQGDLEFRVSLEYTSKTLF